MFSRRPWMVGWYSPRLLLKAGTEVVISSLFGQHADQRTVQALTGPAKIFDYSSGARDEYEIYPRVRSGLESAQEESKATEIEKEIQEDFWFDYVADVGDGWDSTYSVAYQISRTQLALSDPTQKKTDQPHELQQGRLLIFGGDQVYPTASREEYDRRLLEPYRTAFADGVPRPPIDIFAVPGNHDWYDSLRSFSRIFFTDGAFAAGDGVTTTTCTPQTRSYFAIKLPHRWWVLGTDVQLGSDIDANQFEYFRTIVDQIREDEQIILCTAEPHWLQAKRAEKRESVPGHAALDRLEREVLGRRVSVFIAGDVHHYMRYQTVDGTAVKHKITAGGGGAFLHPTHFTWPSKIDDGYQRINAATFPPRLRSWVIGLRNWLFALLNPHFGLLTATLYVIFTLMLLPALARFRQDQRDDYYQQRLESLTARAEQLSREIESLTGIPTPETEQSASLLSPPRLSTAEADATSLPAATNIPAHKFRQWQSRLQLESTKIGAPVREAPEDITPIREQVPESARPEIELKLRDIEDLASSYENTLARRQGLQQQLGKQDFLSGVSGAFDTAAVASTDDDATAAQEASPQTLELATEAGPVAASTPPPEPELIERPWSNLWRLSIQEAQLPDPFQSMLAALVFALTLVAFVAFTDIPAPWGRVLLGTSHGIVHWIAAYMLTLAAIWMLRYKPIATSAALAFVVFAVTTLSVLFTDSVRPSRLRRVVTVIAVSIVGAGVSLLLAILEDHRSLGIVAVVFAGGWVIGSTIWGGYLFLTHTCTGQHWNEAFSSVRCKDWKCFLKLKIARDGSLSIYSVGIPRVCRSWQNHGPHVQPTSGDKLRTVLIEKPIVVPPQSSHARQPKNP